MKTTALGQAALKTGSKCSFTARKLRFFADFRLACPSLATYSHGLLPALPFYLSSGLRAEE
ncbi:hypothetical protein [Phytopseudomonas argentinensis]|uniref:hypothetical protein n=1 Tax=Phytopseudomonas argentinensis TaxID=289370 RepID=UPI001479324F|nr:hypothetical protein [Pseudomonas argentinensis]